MMLNSIVIYIYIRLYFIKKIQEIILKSIMLIIKIYQNEKLYFM